MVALGQRETVAEIPGQLPGSAVGVQLDRELALRRLS